MRIVEEDNRLHADGCLDCFIPENGNPYPLCVGRELPECRDCQIRADWEPEDPYGVER